MSDNFYKISKGLTLTPQGATPANPIDGDIYYDSLLGQLRAYVNGSWTSIGGAASSVPTGSTVNYWLSTAPSGWVMANGNTIGNAASGGTSRADADTQALFIGLWDSIDNTRLPIQDSTGVASTRGVSAIADFNANKRLPLPDTRGRVLAGRDSSVLTVITSGPFGALIAGVDTSNNATAPNGQYRGNTFISTATSSIREISLYINNNEVGAILSGTLRVRIYAVDGSGNTTGGILATSDPINLSSLTNAAVKRTFTFPAPLAVTNGSKYGWVLYTDGASTSTNPNVAVGIFGNNASQAPNNRLNTANAGTSFTTGGTATALYSEVVLGNSADRLTIPINGTILGAAGGAQTHTLSSAEMPAHVHNILPTGSGQAAGAGSFLQGTTAPLSYGNLNTGQAGGTGGVTAQHNNTQPTIVSNIIIKL